MMSINLHLCQTRRHKDDTKLSEPKVPEEVIGWQGSVVRRRLSSSSVVLCRDIQTAISLQVDLCQTSYVAYTHTVGEEQFHSMFRAN